MKKAIIMTKIFFLLSFCINNLSARPVSYVGGWTVMSYNDYYRNTHLTHYSPTSKTSYGYMIQYWQNTEYWINAFNVNYLAKRINKKHSQANFYLKGGLGLLNTDYEEYKNKNELVSYGEFAFDWETRQYFTSYAANFMKSESVDSTFMQKTRLGFAPYTAGYGALHTWLMYELHNMPEYDNTLISNFVLRLFKSTNLLELGMDQNKNTTVNFIKRF